VVRKIEAERMTPEPPGAPVASLDKVIKAAKA